MQNNTFYPIGSQGKPWGDEERRQWLQSTKVQRSYQKEVVSKIKSLESAFDLDNYGALSYNTEQYPLYCLQSKNWDDSKPTILITGGVHGYETSGVHGALKFAKDKAAQYVSHFNFLIAPCISPWGYETINRWNPNAIDPNRSFYANTPSEEAAFIMRRVSGIDIFAHIDLHETTDTDETEFRPALAARDGSDYIKGTIPDGFYTVGDTENPVPAFQKAVIESVRKVTHIAPADESGEIIGSEVTQSGVINYAMKQLGLCGGMTECVFGTTTEVYPDSPRVNDEECNDAQVAAIIGALDYIIENGNT